MKRWLVAIVGAATACSLLTDLDSLEGHSDANGLDAGIDAPAQGFILEVTPHVTADPGDMGVSVNVTIVRATGFGDPVNVAINAPDPKAGITGAQPIAFTGTMMSAPLSFAIATSATDGDYVINLLGQTASDDFTYPIPFGLHVGTLLVATAAGTTSLTVPSFASVLDVFLWGGGGAGGNAAGTVQGSLGGSGGGGGFVSATILVTGGEALTVLVGSGGKAAGGGGGYTAVMNGQTPLAIAGAGGGGGACDYGACSGLPGQSTTAPSACGGASGTATMGGAGSGGGTSGASLAGGNGAQGHTSGGTPGGGKGGNRGGGGGDYGGGGGDICGGGGGGGSSFVATGSMGVVTTAGVGQQAGSWQNPILDGGVVGSGGDAGYYAGNITNPTAGVSGYAVLRLTKP